MKRCKKILSLFLALGLLCMASVNVCARETPDEDVSGTITVKMKYEGKAVSGGTLKAYRVGRVWEDDGDYFFVKTKAMEDFKGSYEEIGDPKLAKKAAAYVKKKKLRAYATARNKDGKAVFSDLEPGLYLIVQTKASDGYEPLNPFLVSVPVNEDGRYVYKVNAEGKFQLRKAATPSTPATPTTSSKPSELTLPQTGQLNWPVPVLVILGLALFAAGWQLRFGKKRDGYER